jgi:hypothetical protein
MKSKKVYITQHKELSSTKLKQVDNIHSPTYYNVVLEDSDLKMVRRGVKNKSQVMLEKLFDGESFDLGTGRNGAVFAAGNTNAPGTSIHFTHGRPDDIHETRNIVLSVSNVLAGLEVYKLGRFEYLSTDSTACISGAAAFTQAYNMIQWGMLDRVLVISCDDGSSHDMLEFFTKYKVCNTINEDRGTFFLGEGASYILLESEEVVSNPSAEVLSAVTYHEHYSNPMGISETGEGYKTVIESYTDNVNVVKLHDTGTYDNEVEKRMVKDILGEVNTLSYKKTIGHTLGSNATIELVKSISDVSTDDVVMCLAAGMGNVYSSIVFKKL